MSKEAIINAVNGTSSTMEEWMNTSVETIIVKRTPTEGEFKTIRYRYLQIHGNNNVHEDIELYGKIMETVVISYLFTNKTPNEVIEEISKTRQKYSTCCFVLRWEGSYISLDPCVIEKKII